ncbi:Na+/H+ antiporter subunit E [Leucobacter sp. cx-328]|uniref:Na+/H+ antiporter subunit E n=1 Tax=unclassified Leucobacter TaxID=2621730 RepID=UPI00165D6C27|nr:MULTISPECIES: Na+/H+ antiporter subunit E [unclassified Leucobacter]MBC9944831.1 Na+/H+ antiporter subunit E [Leucobacter sp. cx-328]
MNSAKRSAERNARRIEWRIRLHEIPLIVGLVILWMMLWREISLLSAVSGLVVAFVAMRVFYLPPVDLAGRFNLWWAIRYLAHFFSQLAIASWNVAWLSVKPGPAPKTSIIEVPLRTRSDFILTMVGLTISLIPGSLVVEVDRYRSTLYLHAIDTPTGVEVAAMRAEVARIERLLILAAGSKEEMGKVR